jgi:hypothetical protein
MHSLRHFASTPQTRGAVQSELYEHRVSCESWQIAASSTLMQVPPFAQSFDVVHGE